ncbi:UvrB/UvrC motif-containing protein [Thalassoroseus pseudoceratinae]|uniref:UvrB/UvrC motif-containing protein n=1 Tax=Thalassoroseus pseudoceratinae TaxID=2713176 RepID=UPI001421AE57|nr:UvrB/UvrC motif-containing protein [Thalassoroseus pseudoceratinae]
MKKCSRCSKPSTLHITEIQEGVAQELHLCESCAKQYLAAPEPMTSESDEFAEKLSESVSEEESESYGQLVCPNCGITFKEFRSQGRLGCPHDYNAFAKELTPLLENIHGETQHVGKCPKRAPEASQKQYELIKLRGRLRAAIDEEDYEMAARIRDEINELEDEVHSSGDDD